MPQVLQHKSHWPKIVAIASGVVIVLGAATGYVVWRLYPSANSSISKSISYVNKGEYILAYSVLHDAYGRAIFASDKRALLANMAAVSVDEDNLPQALGYYQQLNKDEPGNFNVLTNMAGVEARMGHNADAISHYQEAVALLTSGKVTSDSQGTLSYYQDQITQLEASK